MGAVQHWENDNTFPKGTALKRINEEYDVDINWLLTGKGEAYAREPGEMVQGSFSIDTTARPINSDKLRQVITSIETWLECKERSLAPDKKADLITLLYKHFIETDKDVDDRTVVDYLRLVS